MSQKKMFLVTAVILELTIGMCRSYSQSFSMSFPIAVDQLRGYTLVKLFVGKSKPAWFVLDTGTTGAILISWAAAQQLGIDFDENEKIKLSVLDAEMEAYAVKKPPQIEIRTQAEKTGEISFGIKARCLVAPRDYENLQGNVAIIDGKVVQIAGLIGIDAFGSLVVRVSYDNQSLEISTSLEQNEWTDVTGQPCKGDTLLCVRLSIGEHMLDAFLDSGIPVELVLNDTLRRRSESLLTLTVLRREIFDKEYIEYDALLLPAIRFGTSYTNLHRVGVLKSDLPPIWGALGMLYYNWQFDWRNKRVYVQPRKNLPTFHCNYFAAMFMELEHHDGKYTIVTAPSSYLHRVLPRQCELLAVEGIPLQELQKMLQDPQEEVAGFVKSLLLSPLKQEVRLKVRCGDDTREITVRSPLSARQFHELLVYFSRQQLGFKTETDENGGIMLWFSPKAPVRYWVAGQPVDVDDEYRLRLRRIVGLDVEQPTIEELFLHLHSHLLQGKPVQLVCEDDKGREVLVEIPAVEPPKAEDTPSPVPPKETRDE